MRPDLLSDTHDEDSNASESGGGAEDDAENDGKAESAKEESTKEGSDDEIRMSMRIVAVVLFVVSLVLIGTVYVARQDQTLWRGQHGGVSRS